MLGRGEQQEESVFVHRSREGAGVDNVRGESGGGNHGSIVAHEPYGTPDSIMNEVIDTMKQEDAEFFVSTVAHNIIIHDEKPIENLPVMIAPELKLIGRCVSLSVTRKVNDVEHVFYYTGLVSHVTFAAVTLTHVNRYTCSDFNTYIAREKQFTKDGMRAEGGDGGPTTKASGLTSHGYTLNGEVGMGSEGGLAGTQDAAALIQLDAAGSLAPAVQLSAKEIEAFAGASSKTQSREADTAQSSTRALRHINFRSCEVSMGPMPYVTFLRKHIHDVRFGRDPHSSFYSLFQDPSKKLMDMQYLRMFVRRYIVHTSEGNNPRQVPLYAFVTVRCACANMDRFLVYRVAREELPRLMEADRAIEEEKKRKRDRAIRYVEEIRPYQAPIGIFSHTGIFNVSRLRQITFITAIVTLLFVVAFAMYLGICMNVIGDLLMVSYELQLLRFLVPSIFVWFIAAVFILLHSLYMRVSLHTTSVMLLLCFMWSAGAVACAVMVMVVILERLKNSKLFIFMNAADSRELCDFYSRYECSGFWSTCQTHSSEEMCRSFCAQKAGSYYSDACYPYLWDRVHLQLIPLLVFTIILLCAFFYSIFVLWKLWTTTNAIRERMR